MMNVMSLWTNYASELQSDPLLVLALTAALVAMASTPIAFAILGRMEWFKARRGRVMQRPEFASIVVGLILVMAIPAIFAALVLKSRSFDKNRYEFDPNKTWSVLEQGRGLASVKEADLAVQGEMERLALGARIWWITSRSLMRPCSHFGRLLEHRPRSPRLSPGSCSHSLLSEEALEWMDRNSSWTSPRRRPC